jgi:jouberin
MKNELLNLRDENNQQNIIDKKSAIIRQFFNPTPDPEMKINMQEAHIWKGFPRSDRFWYYFLCKSSSVSDNAERNGRFHIEDMILNPCKLGDKIDIINKILCLRIIKTGTLDIEPSIIHPYVKISIVNLKTGRYLQKMQYEMPLFLKNEKNLVIGYDKINNNHEYKESYLDFIPPFATPPYDLREKGESYAEWNEDFVINDDAGNLLSSNNIIFFEIMDFNFFIKKDDYTVPIAWGYLKPVGYSQTYLGKFKIQLYKYKYTPTEAFKKLGLKYARTPSVLFEFNWVKKEKYQTYLEVELTLENKPNENDLKSMLYLQRKFRNTVFIPEGEEEVDKEVLLTQSKQILKSEEFDHHDYKKRRTLLLRRRGLNEDCILPDRLLFKFNTSKLGCLTHDFSHDGRYLAAACTDLNSVTTIKIFNVEEGVLRYHFKGHQQLIHQMVWSDDNEILISASADNFVTLWSIPKDDSNNMENLEYQDNDKIFKLYSIPHPSYVFSI